MENQELGCLGYFTYTLPQACVRFPSFKSWRGLCGYLLFLIRFLITRQDFLFTNNGLGVAQDLRKAFGFSLDDS